jgi:hypothetical protein
VPSSCLRGSHDFSFSKIKYTDKVVAELMVSVLELMGIVTSVANSERDKFSSSLGSVNYEKINETRHRHILQFLPFCGS